MPPTFLIIITSLLIISLAVSTAKSDSHHVTVRPTDSDPSICGDHAACDTLSNLISDNSSFFSDGLDLTLTFLKGTHRLNLSGEQLKIEGKRNIIWFGESAVIVCQMPLAIIFVDIEYLELKNLSVSKCGDKMHSDSISENSILHTRSISAALFVSSVYTFHMEGVLIEFSNGYGLFTFNLHGNTNIHKCFFVDNNKNCSSSQLSSEACVGGNIAMYFFTRHRANVVKRLANISITSSTIGGGSDESLTTATCTNRLEMADSPSVSKANGLAVIFAQFNYQVNVSVLETKFHNNTGNHRHPAVLVHDYSRVVNYVQIHSSSFEESAVLISMSKTNESSNLSETTDSETVLIKNCSFKKVYYLRPDAFMLLMCIKSSLASNLSPLRFQTIMITACTIYSYNYQFNSYFFQKSIIQVFYVFPHINSFPITLIEINNCSFLMNNIPFFYFTTTNKKILANSYNQNYNSFSILTIKYSQIEYCSSWIEGAKNRRITDVELSNCTFISARIVAINAHVVLRDCTFSKSKHTPVLASNSIIAVDGQNIFEQNKGIHGGALYLDKSILLLMPKSRTIISRNKATYGGGIYAEPITPSRKSIGLFRLCTITQLQSSTHLELINNQALYAGDSIYGGRYTKCAYNCTGEYECQALPDTDTFDYEHLPEYISITPHSDETKYTEVTSPANRICLCENNEPTDHCKKFEATVFPGQEFNTSVIALGKLNGATPVIMTSRSGDFELNIDNGLYSLTGSCTTLSYSVHSISSNVSHQTITLRISEETTKVAQLDQSQLQNFKIEIHFSSCPRGLVFSAKSYKCVCHSFLKNFSMSCDTTNGQVQIKDKQWIGYYNNSKLVVITSYPLDYLISGDKHINLSEPNKQCNFSRIGILCGACQADLSAVLGTSNCMECSNFYLLLIIPFALAGVALVVLLLKCNLTVSVGHINGIIFYANIVQVNKALLQNIPHQAMSTFIAWLNLDLGIETCFSEGMNSLTKVWLQFVFPVYLWLIIVIIVVLAHYSSRMSKIIGNNSVPVLATLFLLSYAKLLRTVIAVISFTFLYFESGQYFAVWLEDGNVWYFSSEHIPLFLAALTFTFLYILPLTLLTLLAPCLQAKSHYTPFKWVNRLKPFLDAYQGPYRDKFRYWTGLMLVLRILLFVIYASNYENDPSMSFFWTILIIGPLGIICLLKSIYRHRFANIIESVSLLNITLVSAVSWLTTTTHYTKWPSIREYTIYLSVVVMMAVSVSVLLYQIVQCVIHKMNCSKQGIRLHNRSTNSEDTSNIEPTVSAPTSSVVELKECDQLKEPLLEFNN